MALYSTVKNQIALPSLSNGLAKQFLRVFYNSANSLGRCDGVPDISGYTLIFLIPPELSGVGFSFLPSTYSAASNTIFQALEFTPPQASLSYDQLQSGANNKIPYATSKTSGGQMSITFLENMGLDVYSFHNNWLHYIEQVVLGYLEPSSEYIESGELDYATSAFVVRFKPDFQTMVYLGKAVGIFPVSLPNKEIIGSRQQTQLTTFSVDYICTDYREISLTGADIGNVSRAFVDNTWVLADFIEAAAILFGHFDVSTLGNLILANMNNPMASSAAAESMWASL